MLTRLKILLQTALALLVQGPFVEPLVAADFDQELARNTQLRSSSPQQQAAHRGSLQALVLFRLERLRIQLLVSALFIASACLTAFFLHRHPDRGFAQPGNLLLAVVSIFCFASATLGRLGWKGQSIKGDTSVERLDQAIFWLLYWLGTFFGVLAVL